MKKYLLLAALALAATAGATQPDYRTVHLQIDVNRPARQVWARAGGYCDISKWMNVDCRIVSGDGGVGTVRALAGGKVQEILVGRTPLSYGYTQPVQPGQFYNLYHGYIEVRPVTARTSRVIYTIMMDESNKPDEAARQADLARFHALFTTALEKIKALAEGDASAGK